MGYIRPAENKSRGSLLWDYLFSSAGGWDSVLISGICQFSGAARQAPVVLKRICRDCTASDSIIAALKSAQFCGFSQLFRLLYRLNCKTIFFLDSEA